MTRRKREAAVRAPRARNGNAPQRQRLIHACISALHLYGPSRTTVEKVVAIARMSPGIVRFYFDSKAAMMVASLQFLAAEFEEQVLMPVTRLKATPVAALERMVELYLDPEIASPRKVSVWYSFWGEASSRQEYYDICGQKDASFAALVQELIERLIEEGGFSHLEPAGVALGLIGVLEMLWQDFAFQSEDDIDRRAARARAMSYLRSVFPGRFAPQGPAAAGAARPPRLAAWAYASEAAHRIEREAIFRPAAQLVGHALELEQPGAYLACETGAERVLLVRDHDGRIHALRNCCPQAPHALILERRGHLTGDLECPVHRLRFAWDGAPRTTGSGRSPQPLMRLALEEGAGLLFVRGEPGTGVGLGIARSGRGSGAREWPRELVPLARAAPIELEADWKILIEQWLEGDGRVPINPESWSARRYRALAGPGALDRWSERFIEPNLWLEERPGGCSILQVVPLAAGRCRVERLDFVAGARRSPSRRIEPALQYLASRLLPRLRRAARVLAESAQQGLVAYDYARPAGAASARFHQLLLERAAALGLDRAPPRS
jgi:TetR/AcrR family transcriptional repressor of bet genes